MQEKQLVGTINHRLSACAAGWYARVRAPDCSTQEREALEAWLAADERHRQAYASVVDAAQRVSRALASDPRLRALMEEAPAAKTPCNARRVGRLAVAAGLMAAIGLALFASPRLPRPSAAPEVARYENPEPRERQVILADGSVLHLDAGSLVTAQLRTEARLLTLLKGRAYFEVAHDATRPFSVDAAGTRTVALGTKFEVQLQAEGVAVTLAEGSVAVTPTDTGNWKQTLSPGQQLVLDAAHPEGRLMPVDATRITSWASGRLVFDGTPLAEVLEEVNRYSSIRVVLGDDRLAATPIGGSFASGGDAGAFVQALAAILPVRSEPSGDHEIVLFQRERYAAKD